MSRAFSAADQNGDALLETVANSVPQVEQALFRLEAVPLDREALEMMYRHTAQIGRTASLMECPALAQLAHGMEGTLADVLEGFARLDPPTLSLLRRTLGAIQALLDRLRGERSGAVGLSGVFNGHEAGQARVVVEATISEAASFQATDHPGDRAELSEAVQSPDGRRRPLRWLRFRSEGAFPGRPGVFSGQRTPLGRDCEQEETRAGQSAETRVKGPGPRPQEQQAVRAIDVIRAGQLQRRTGNLTMRRGSGITAEEGWIQFELGQITGAAAGRRRDADARNWLSTWGACRYLFEETGPSP
ncbi:MAG: hypothetical protein ACRDOE_00370 [Streptosporangiaceae bacterium]